MILTDDKQVKQICDSLSIDCEYIKTNYSLEINSVGKVIAKVNARDHDFNISLQEYYKDDRFNIEKIINGKHNGELIIINAYKPSDKSQFNFDMFLMSLTCKDLIKDVKRSWFNSYEEFKTFAFSEYETLPPNTNFKNRRLFYMTTKILESYWYSSSAISRNQLKLSIYHYYILALLLEQEDVVKGNKQSMDYTLPVSFNKINGKLEFKNRSKFKTVQSAQEVHEKSKDPFSVFRSKFKTKTISKKVLFNKPTLLEATEGIANNNEVLNNLFTKGYITNPNTKNTNVSSKQVNLLVGNISKFAQRYSPLFTHVQSEGYLEEDYENHIYANYVDEYSVKKDQTHAILPLPGGNVNLLDEKELAMYDLIVKRYFSIFLKPPVKFVQKIEARNDNEVLLILNKEAYFKYGSDIFEMRKESIYEELNIDLDMYSNENGVGTIIDVGFEDVELKGALSREKKNLSKKQLLKKLTNMGKKMISRHLQTKYRHFQIGNASSWKSYIEKLEDYGLIIEDEDSHYILTEEGHHYIDYSKAFLMNVENLNTLYLPIINVFTSEASLVDIITNHIETVELVIEGPLYHDVVTANYDYVVNNYKCKCGKPLKEHANFLGCSSYPECKFTISKKLKNGPDYKLKEKDLIELLIEGKTSTVIRDFKFITSGKKANVTFKFGNNKWIEYDYHK